MAFQAERDGNFASTESCYVHSVHLLCQQAICTRSGLPDLALRASIAVLRHSDLLEADFLFYHAGELCRLAGKPEAMPVYVNRFVDIHDFAKSGNLSAANMDHKKFEATVSDSAAAKLNEWMIQETVAGQVDPQLSTAARRKCGRQRYAANLHCQFCKVQFEFCHVTGYPVANGTKCSSCGVIANRTDWGLFIAKTGRSTLAAMHNRLLEPNERRAQ
jgi:intraflagellar transport protein 172